MYSPSGLCLPLFEKMTYSPSPALQLRPLGKPGTRQLKADRANHSNDDPGKAGTVSLPNMTMTPGKMYSGWEYSASNALFPDLASAGLSCPDKASRTSEASSLRDSKQRRDFMTLPGQSIS